jgi:lipopolysaccharide transport system ATP-binding protein
MSATVIQVDRLSKRYRLGTIGGRRLADDLNRWWATFRGKADPLSKIEPSLASNPSRHSDTICALNDVSFEVNQGEVLGIIGRNGAGKSTLLKILSRVTAPSSGEVRVKGRIASLLEVGTGFHQELTGRENIFLNGAILGMTKAEIRSKFDEILAFAEVEKFIDTPVKRYSSGMYVRLAFAVAAHLDPEILIVDEVLAVGDAAFQKKCLGKMQDVAGEGRTVLFVSHNMSAVTSLCKRAILLTQGCLTIDKTAGKAVEHYIALNASHAANVWQPGSSENSAAIRFSSASIAEYGLGVLRFTADLQTIDRHRPAFVAFDLTDRAGTPIMQILPEVEPFLRDSNRMHRVEVEVEMPPLIPGRYLLDLWVGSHFSETIDYVRGALAFQSIESPTAGRSFPHSSNHGFLVPKSRVRHSVLHDSQG